MAVLAEKQPASGQPFVTDCRRCSRLAAFRDESRKRFPGYFGRPVPSWGDPQATLLIVGLAPGLHGANATGRPFTGDFAGILLYETLHELGFASGAQSQACGDGLELHGCRITNAVRCVPPENRPTSEEIRNCNGYLSHEIQALPEHAVILALGRIAHGAVVRAMALQAGRFPFAHGSEHTLGASRTMLDSYHCSRYNTQTRRLTKVMFHDVFSRARGILNKGKSGCRG